MSRTDAILRLHRTLERRGWRVSEEPTMRVGTEALRPDILAVRDGETLVVEVKSTTEKLDPKEHDHLRSLADQHGWSVMLWQYDPAAETAFEPTAPEGEDHYESLEWPSLRDDEAFLRLVQGSARLERTLREIEDASWATQTEIEPEADRDLQLKPADLSWRSLLHRLATLGFVEPGEYETIRAWLTQRDRLTHGFPVRFYPDEAEDPAELERLNARIVERAERLMGMGFSD